MRKGLAISALILIVALTPALAQEAEKPDPRLAARVTLPANEITLADLAKKLTEQTHVTIGVDPRPAQWSVRQRKVTMAVTDVPLVELQIALKKLLMYSWKKTGSEGAWEYVLYQSEADRAREGRLRDDKLATQSREKIARIQRASDRYRQMLSLSPQQASQLRESDPWAYLITNWQPARSLGRVLESLPQAGVDRVADGGRYSIPYSQMSPRMQAWTKDFLNGITDVARRIENKPDAMPEITDEKLANLNLTLEAPPAEMGPIQDQVVAMVKIEGLKGMNMDFPLPNPDSEFARMIGEMATQVVIDGKDPKEVTQNVQSQMQQLAVPMMKRLAPQVYSTERPPKDPVLLQQVELPADIARGPLGEVLKKLSTALKMPMAADQYPSSMPFPMEMAGGIPDLQMTGRMPLYQALNKLGLILGKVWTREGSFIVWQDPEWYIKRTWDVPEEWIAYFKGKVKDGALPLDVQAQMARFSEDQIIHTIARTSELAWSAREAARDRDALNLYASLNGSQKRRLLAGQALPTANLTQAQWQMASAALMKSRFSGDPQGLLVNGMMDLKMEGDAGTQATIIFHGAEGAEQRITIGASPQPKPTMPPAPKPPAPQNAPAPQGTAPKQ